MARLLDGDLRLAASILYCLTMFDSEHREGEPDQRNNVRLHSCILTKLIRSATYMNGRLKFPFRYIKSTYNSNTEAQSGRNSKWVSPAPCIPMKTSVF